LIYLFHSSLHHFSPLCVCMNLIDIKISFSNQRAGIIEIYLTIQQGDFSFTFAMSRYFFSLRKIVHIELAFRLAPWLALCQNISIAQLEIPSLPPSYSPSPLGMKVEVEPARNCGDKILALSRQLPGELEIIAGGASHRNDIAPHIAVLDLQLSHTRRRHAGKRSAARTDEE